MGLRLFRLVGFSEGFLYMGVTSAWFRGKREIPVERLRLNMRVREHRIEQDGAQSNFLGIGSSGLVVW